MSRNNEDRIGINDRNAGAEAPPVPTQTTTSHNTQPQSSLSFVSPTEFVELPSKGKYYPEGHPLHNKDVIEIKHMTAKEEDILTSQTLLKQGKALDRLLEQVIVDRNINPDSLLIGDKNTLLIAIRKSGYGAEYITQVACPSCQEGQEYSFDLNDVKTITGDIKDFGDVIEKTNNGTFIIKELPVTKWSVEIRPLNGRDERSMSAASESRRKHKLPEDALTTQMTAFIVSISGVTDKAEIANAVRNMPAKDAREVRSIYQKIMPNVDMTQTFACESCEYNGDMEVPFTTDFFWPKQ